MTKQNKCILCGNKYTNLGHNAQPLAKGLCCDKCYYSKILKARIKLFENIPTKMKGGILI